MSVMRAISPHALPHGGSAAYCGDLKPKHITKGRSYHPLPLSRWPDWLSRGQKTLVARVTKGTCSPAWVGPAGLRGKQQPRGGIKNLEATAFGTDVYEHVRHGHPLKSLGSQQTQQE